MHGWSQALSSTGVTALASSPQRQALVLDQREDQGRLSGGYILWKEGGKVVTQASCLAGLWSQTTIGEDNGTAEAGHVHR